MRYLSWWNKRHYKKQTFDLFRLTYAIMLLLTWFILTINELITAKQMMCLFFIYHLFFIKCEELFFGFSIKRKYEQKPKKPNWIGVFFEISIFNDLWEDVARLAQ